MDKNQFHHDDAESTKRWVRASQILSHANQETNGSVEAYHVFLKKQHQFD